jgi:L-fucose isomerase-like protein
MTYRRFSTDDFTGQIRGYMGEGEFTDDPLETFGGAGVLEIPKPQNLLRYVCKNAFEHHVAASFSQTAGAVYEAANTYLGWKMHYHEMLEE